VLFPFLHGLEGNNVAQNLFFSHSRVRDGLPPQVAVPRYRGLMLVACPARDEDGVVNMDVESSESSDSFVDQLGYEDDTQIAAVNASNVVYRHRDDFMQNQWTLQTNTTRHHSASVSSSSSSPLSASTTATSLWSEPQQQSTDLLCDDNDSTLTESPPPTHPRTSACRLISSVLPHEILSPTEASFVKPYIPDGISL
jgi:hypothetical protein